MRHKARAIIMKRVAYGEADWIVTFFDRERGRMSGMAKSARSSIKRFGGALEPGTQVEMSCASRHSSGLVRIEEARVLESPNGAVKSLERIAGMARALDLAMAFLQEGQPAPEKFDLLAERLAVLSSRDPRVSEGVLFELEWLKLSGFGPRVESCSLCEAEAVGAVAGVWSFDMDRGGLLCPACSMGAGLKVRLASGALGALQKAAAGKDEGDGFGAAGDILARYVDHVVGRPLKVWRVA